MELHNKIRAGTKIIVFKLIYEIYPWVTKIHSKLELYNGKLPTEDLSKIHDTYSLTCSQIKKCIMSLTDVFKQECKHKIYLQETRECILERLTWCLNKLMSMEKVLDNSSNFYNDSSNDSILITTMYFVNWIDNTFDFLNKLADIVYRTDNKENEAVYESWKNDMMECVVELHGSINELLLSAMTLCKYCLCSDQTVIKARCQVVLRETKSLLSELINGDTTSFKATIDTLKLPVMPSNVNILIDVLKDVLYVLETNTNTAIMALLIHCFSRNIPAITVLKDHFSTNVKGICVCLKSEDSSVQECCYVKDFDLYNERLLQLGSFAVSCSSDQNRISSLRNGLASLEALDPHLVPALMMSPEGAHANLLINYWHQEVKDIRDSIFLIVDPAAFAERSKHTLHDRLIKIIKGNSYNSNDVCTVINIGCMVYDFFQVYQKYEPDSLDHHEEISPLLDDLHKVQMECKIVSNMLRSGDDYAYDIPEPRNKREVSMSQLVKRLKLLYTLVNRIHSVLHPKDNDTQFFTDEACEEIPVKNVTHTVYKTYSSKKTLNNMSRSVFARTTKVRLPNENFPLLRLTRHLQQKTGTELSFSAKLDQLVNEDIQVEGNDWEDNKCAVFNNNFESVREASIFYPSPIKNRTSLRKVVLNKRNNLTYDSEMKEDVLERQNLEESFLDEATSLQITDVLNQINELTYVFSARQSSCKKSTQIVKKRHNRPKKGNETINMGHQTITDPKDILNIPVGSSTVDDNILLDDDSVPTDISTLSSPSNVNTLERISDLDLIESRLSSLKLQLETSL